jgi:hypothetical protein
MMKTPGSSPTGQTARFYDAAYLSLTRGDGGQKSDRA